MILRYRGKFYETNRTTLTTQPHSVEGKYHGIKTCIPLPLVRDSVEDRTCRMVYRGVSFMV